VPADVSDDRRQDDHADAPDEHRPQHHGEGRKHDGEDQDLADLDAEIKREQREEEVLPGASVDTSNPAIDGQGKTGHRGGRSRPSVL
jgi:hypothetical protein